MEQNKTHLSDTDKRAILRAADEIIAQGGRTLLAKILKGSHEKKVLQLELNKCPSYGYFRTETLEEIMKKIDWMIDCDFLDIVYSGKLAVIVYTERGWLIESDLRADEFLNEWDQWLAEGLESPDMSYLKDRNREMIYLFLDMVGETKDRKYIPYLKVWEKIDYKKVAARIREKIKLLEAASPDDNQSAQQRKAAIDQALEGSAPKDLLLKCWECGERFTFTVGEQQFYKQKGFDYPKRCDECKEKRYLTDW